MPCDKNTCRTCIQISQFRAFKSLLPASVRDSFEEWFNQVYGDLEQAQMDNATSSLEWRQDGARYSDETELRYQHRLEEWKEYERQRVSNH